MLSYAVVALLSVSLAVLLIPPDWSAMFGTESSKGSPVRLLSRSELALHGGEQGSMGLYVAILGHVFDVHKGEKHYGPGGAYHFMAGNPQLCLTTLDSTRGSPNSPLYSAFVSTCLYFQEKTPPWPSSPETSQRLG